eukprot:s2941_g16.t1
MEVDQHDETESQRGKRYDDASQDEGSDPDEWAERRYGGLERDDHERMVAWANQLRLQRAVGSLETRRNAAEIQGSWAEAAEYARAIAEVQNLMDKAGEQSAHVTDSCLQWTTNERRPIVTVVVVMVVMVVMVEIPLMVWCWEWVRQRGDVMILVMLLMAVVGDGGFHWCPVGGGGVVMVVVTVRLSQYFGGPIAIRRAKALAMVATRRDAGGVQIGATTCIRILHSGTSLGVILTSRLALQCLTHCLVPAETPPSTCEEQREHAHAFPKKATFNACELEFGDLLE